MLEEEADKKDLAMKFDFQFAKHREGFFQRVLRTGPIIDHEV